jgi:hypothetical protein
MRTNHQNYETTLESCYRSSLSDVLIGGGTVLGLILALAWPSLKVMFGS